MTDERRFQTAFRVADTGLPGLIQKDDGTVWLVNPDGSETQLPGGAGSLPFWTDLSGSLGIDNGTVDLENSYAFALLQAADPGGAFPSVTSLWVRIVYDTYTGGGEPGVLAMTLPNSTAAVNENYRNETGEISGFWSTGGIGSATGRGGAWWSSVDGTVNVDGAPVFSDGGDILICGVGIFPSF